jgi:ribosomal-protein-alanine N-acetyltransferase
VTKESASSLKRRVSEGLSFKQKEGMMNVTAIERSMVVRSATEKDLDRVLEIDQLSFPTPWTYHCFKITLKDIFFVIEEKEIMGYLVACLCDLGLKAEVLRIAVHPDHRGKGIAKELIETMLQLLSKENVESVELEVNSANRGAVKLYEKFGFEIKRIATFIADQDFYIFYVMKLKLREPEEVKNQVLKKYYHVGNYYDLQIAG